MPCQAAFLPHRKWMNEWIKCFHWINELKDRSVFSGLSLLLGIYMGSARQPGGRAYFFYRQDHGMKWVTHLFQSRLLDIQWVLSPPLSLACHSPAWPLGLFPGSVWRPVTTFSTQKPYPESVRNGLSSAGNSPSEDAKTGSYLHSYTSSSKQGKDTQGWGCKLVKSTLLSSTCFWSLVILSILICFPHFWSFENIPPPPSNWL